ncbi:hypothetical protein SOVF_073650 isoform C [Spinacia oleracea]|nr:hypothetical protein SOVF_073650 isoform C [Spinacia oleracea]
MPSVNLSLACDHQFVNVILVFSLCNLGFDIHSDHDPTRMHIQNMFCTMA